MDPGIICFHHCQKKFFCLSVPLLCPVCNRALDGKDYSSIPFRIPYPFIKARQFPRGIVMRPTNGDFLHDYYNSKDLHIGVTTSCGVVIDFGEKGVGGVEFLRKDVHPQSSQTAWDQSLLLEQFHESWGSYWDEVLYQVSTQPHWDITKYDEESNNCFSFVLEFLKELKCEKISQIAEDPKLFCEQFIVTRTSSAGKYISLYRQLQKKPIIVCEAP